MKENAVKTKLKNKQPVFGVLSNSPDPTIAEMCGVFGLDYYMIDSEHSPISPGQALDIVRACELGGITPLARIRSNDPKLILQFIDAGVMGIMMPGIKTAEDLQALVRAVKYPPAGDRGLGFVRMASYLQGPFDQKEYIEFANEQMLVLPQIETKEAVDNLDELLTVPGIDGFVVGPRDLALSLGYIEGPGHEDVKRTIARVVEKINQAGLVAGTTAASGDQAKALIDRGVLFCLNSIAGLLKTSITEFTKKRVI
ncbi:HpcH/HpaI aldolase family protein [Arsenicibacter rosenii]|uniref:Host specificity protein n=1 Tax=Arsenicibacter rosenii TaxID=1750698 RepID=A0A1S2VLJ7_9BACT|nr:aldolase/citrate lyase family protein [Arsenicibacter rosenii]OIN59634.1 host specificity protein [Arsenicibacter rosenii]